MPVRSRILWILMSSGFGGNRNFHSIAMVLWVPIFPRRMFWKTLRFLTIPRSCGMKAILLRVLRSCFWLREDMGVLEVFISPEVGECWALSILRSVVLPLPDGPISAMISPCSTSMFILSRAVVEPKVLWMFMS